MDDSIISIDVVRDFLEAASHKPLGGRQRVYIFCEAEKMNVQAQNCILKTLEEPIPHVTILLIAQHSGELLPTIVSRCQSVRFGLVAEERIRALLRAKTPLSEDDAAFLASMSGGRPGWALHTAGRPQLLDLRYRTREMVERLLSCAGAEALGLAEAVIEFAESLWRAENTEAEDGKSALSDAGAQSRIARSSQTAFLDLLAEWFRDMLLVQFPECEPAVTNLQALDWLKNVARTYSPRELLRLIEQIHGARHFILANANGHLVLEVLFLNLVRTTRRL
jgi:DNA polymerase-3 subunit delta'